MPKFKVSAQHIEYLQAKIIEANDAEEATDKYIQLWDDGYIPVVNSEIGTIEIKEVI